MKIKSFVDSPILATAAALAASSANAADPGSAQELVDKIKGTDEAARGEAWQHAGACGAPAVRPLGELLDARDPEIARAAKRALWKIVRYAGRPGSAGETKAVSRELLGLLGGSNIAARREIVWMLSEVGGDESVEPLAACLVDEELREDARAALQRLPGKKSLEALKSALGSVPMEYKNAIAVSLRARGTELTGYQSEKLRPTKKTGVKPLTPV